MARRWAWASRYRYSTRYTLALKRRRSCGPNLDHDPVRDLADDLIDHGCAGDNHHSHSSHVQQLLPMGRSNDHKHHHSQQQQPAKDNEYEF